MLFQLCPDLKLQLNGYDMDVCVWCSRGPALKPCRLPGIWPGASACSLESRDVAPGLPANEVRVQSICHLCTRPSPSATKIEIDLKNYGKT